MSEQIEQLQAEVARQRQTIDYQQAEISLLTRAGRVNDRLLDIILRQAEVDAERQSALLLMGKQLAPLASLLLTEALGAVRPKP